MLVTHHPHSQSERTTVVALRSASFTERWTNKAKGVQTECSRSTIMYVLNTRKAAAKSETLQRFTAAFASQTFETLVIFMKPAPVFCAGYHIS
jgi:hypothetical protein